MPAAPPLWSETEEIPSWEDTTDILDERPLERESSDYVEPPSPVLTESMRPALSSLAPRPPTSIISQQIRDWETGPAREAEQRARIQSGQSQAVEALAAEYGPAIAIAREREGQAPGTLGALNEEYKAKLAGIGVPTLSEIDAGKNPIVEPVGAEEYQRLTGWSKPVATVAAGAQQFGSSMLEMFKDPLVIAGTGGKAVKPMSEAIAAAFGADMIRHAPEQVKEAYENWVKGDKDKAIANVLRIGASAYLSPKLLKHGFPAGPTLPPIPPQFVETVRRVDAAVPGALNRSLEAAAKSVAEKRMSDRVQQLEKSIEKGVPTDAIQEPSAAEGVLRQERSEVGLQEVRQPQAEIVDAIPREPARTQGGEEGQVLLTPEAVAADIARYNEIQAAVKKASETDPLALFNDPMIVELFKENEAIKNRYGGDVPTMDMAKGINEKAIPAATEAVPSYGEKYLKEMGTEGAIARVEYLRKRMEEAGPRQSENLASESDNIGRALKAENPNYDWVSNKIQPEAPGATAEIPARQAPVVEPGVGAVPQDVSVPKSPEQMTGAEFSKDYFAKNPGEYDKVMQGIGVNPDTLHRSAIRQAAAQGKEIPEFNKRFVKLSATGAEAKAGGAAIRPLTKDAAQFGIQDWLEQSELPHSPQLAEQLLASNNPRQTLKEAFAGGSFRPETQAEFQMAVDTLVPLVERTKARVAQPLPEPAGPKAKEAGWELPAASQVVPAAGGLREFPQTSRAEAKLAEVVNQTIEQSSPTRLGVSPAATMRPMDVVLGAPDLRSISPAVEARWQQAVKGTEGIIEKVKTQAGEAWKSVTREYADLPPREFPAEIDVLRRQRASPNASARTAVDVLKGITNNLGPKQYGVFNRVALLEDLVKDVESGKYATGNDLPFGYKDAGELTADLNKFRAISEATPQIKAALERRREFMDSMRGTLVERGFLPESVLSDPRYFHHQVLLYMAEKNAPAGSRSFRDWFSGWQKKRTGSSKDYNRQYVEAEAEVIADAFNKITNQDLHGEMQGIADIAPQLKEVHGAEWRQHLPKGYTTWQPKRGNIFYQVQTVAERVMDRYLSGLGDILPSEFKEALAMGGRKQEWVIPKPLAKVLDNIAPRPDNWIGRLATTAQNSWKRYILLNPLRAAKYNLNNLSGDLDFLFAAQPKIFKEFKSSAGDMWGFHVKGKAAVGDIKEAIQDGVIGSGWRASELPDIARSDYFNWLTGEKPKLVDRYWNWIGKRNDAREDTGRLASYRFAKKEWEAGRPFYGASVPADVDALATPRLKAAKVAREILIDYGRGTEFSNFTRQKLVPFFKWMEGNFVRYQQLIRNVSEHEGVGARVAGVAGKKAATLGLRMAAAYGIVNLWNHMLFPKEEEELGEARNQLHLILGRDDQGNIQTIRFQGALSDLLGWVGGEDLPQDVKDVATGKASVGDKMEDAYEAGISRAVNASLPFPKTAAEIGLGRSFYPNALSPRPVRDKAEHAAGLFSLKPVYQWLAGKPHKPLRQEIANLISYTTDPGEAAYNTTRHMAGEWLEEHGEERANVIPGKRSNALYYYKQALRYKDQETAKKFLDEYNKLGGKREGLNQSIKASAPLSMLGNNRKAFLDSLSPQEQEAVRRAEEWYRRVYARPPTPNPNP